MSQEMIINIEWLLGWIGMLAQNGGTFLGSPQQIYRIWCTKEVDSLSPLGLGFGAVACISIALQNLLLDNWLLVVTVGPSGLGLSIILCQYFLYRKSAPTPMVEIELDQAA